MDGSAPKLSDLLRHPDDLDSIATLKLDFQRKKAAIDDQLRGGLREQLETTQTGMTGLSDSQKMVHQIKEEMMKIDKLCSESQNMIKDLATINAVSQAHRNFAAVETMRRNLVTFNDRLNQVERMLQQDDDDPETMPNILAVHYELTQLRNIRDDALEQIQRADDTSLQSTLEDYFQRLDDTVDWFDEHVGMLALNLVNLVVNDNRSLVVRFAAIIEAEEKSDQRVLALQEALRDHREMASRFQGITEGARTVRGYKEKYLEAIRLNGEAQFKLAREEFLDDPSQLDKSLRWFFNDLNAVKVGMTPLMPRKWRVLQTYGNIYHKLMHDFLLALVDDPEGSTATTLEIVSWPDKYYRKMAKLGLRQDTLQPHVIDGREAELVRDFRQLIIRFLDEWIDRIFKQERKDFADRATAEGSNLDQDEYGYFRTRNLVDLWRMLREQVDAAETSKRADVMEGVLDAMFSRLRTRQQSWQKMLQEECQRFESGKAGPELEGFQALQDWLVATANDQIACVDDGDEDSSRPGYVATFRQKFEPLVSPQYLDRADTELSSLRDGYVDLSTWCLTRFANLIFTIDFRSVLPDLFTPKWYSATAVKQMTATFDEYIADYSQVMHHSLLDIFVEILADELLVRYLSSVHNKSAKFRRTDPFQDKLFDDVSSVLDWLSTLPSTDVASSVRQTWRVTEDFLSLLTCPRDAVADQFENFKRAYWDLNIAWVEAVLRTRDDFERGMVNDVKARAAQMEVVRGPETIMSKVK